MRIKKIKPSKRCWSPDMSLYNRNTSSVQKRTVWVEDVRLTLCQTCQTALVKDFSQTTSLMDIQFCSLSLQVQRSKLCEIFTEAVIKCCGTYFHMPVNRPVCLYPTPLSQSNNMLQKEDGADLVTLFCSYCTAVQPYSPAEHDLWATQRPNRT